MKTRVLIASLMLVGFAGTAMADTYYVVRDAKTKHCTVVTEKPKKEVLVTQIGPVAFKTKVAAENRIKKTKVCVVK